MYIRNLSVKGVMSYMTKLRSADVPEISSLKYSITVDAFYASKPLIR